ncbi:UTP--glucose-1-phosphate uridylyltransferase [Candidatus Kinetoplastibacterium sorsogonicusi]|uniref:UTP--glucose-1-phosphate uridylyltransferase n=1 Tax=Candidatus Kinetoplastidibacterium kentomonadis TaxID=1576550 RepID=A0A3Q8EYC1_9PROT|nr:UTP--glucose-1-phosphate uridylyltransferase GalU [Candidatus Kinetoplastibacterium sorsogonicusi]AWD32625.1 UTP--glucose-1-phosphate uridylyltransferase [Candidatus Kinetoplastibacterium sorsogonicusi]
MGIINKAIFPVGGMGTRLLPATKAMPKEMLSIIDKPILQYAVEEALRSGITELIFITGRNKLIIEDHFDTSPELEQYLLEKEKYQLLKNIKSILPKKAICIYLRQSGPLGLGHAILIAEKIIGKNPFAIILPDDLIDSKIPITKKLINIYKKYQQSILCIEKINVYDSVKYGMVSSKSLNQVLGQINHIVEKPLPINAPSNLAIVGRYILNYDIFDFLKKTPKGINNEIHLTDAISLMIKKHTVLTYKHRGIRYDCGSKQGLFKANIEFGIKYHNLTI